MVGIQKLFYPAAIKGMTNDDFEKIKDYKFVIWQSKFSESSTVPVGGQNVTSIAQMTSLITGRADIEHQAILRKKTSTPENPSIEDEFDCLFVQGNPMDNSSVACMKERNEFSPRKANCEYFQACKFTAVKGKDCELIASNIAALVIPVVILLLGTAIFAIYCFKKKADKAEKADKELKERLPVIGLQDSTRSNDKRPSILPRFSKSDKNDSLNKSVYNGPITPG